VKDVTKDRSDVVKLAGTNNQTGGGVISTICVSACGEFDLCLYAVYLSVTVVHPDRAGSQRWVQHAEYTSPVGCRHRPYTSKLQQLVEAGRRFGRAGPSTVHRQ